MVCKTSIVHECGAFLRANGEAGEAGKAGTRVPWRTARCGVMTAQWRPAIIKPECSVTTCHKPAPLPPHPCLPPVARETEPHRKKGKCVRSATGSANEDPAAPTAKPVAARLMCLIKKTMGTRLKTSSLSGYVPRYIRWKLGERGWQSTKGTRVF